MSKEKSKPQIMIDRSLYDDANVDRSSYKSQPGITKEVVLEMSKQKNEPEWMLEKRLKSFEFFQKEPLPTWGPDLKPLNLDEIIYFVRPGTEETRKWEDLPEDIVRTFDKLGIPEAEKKALAGVGAQYDCLTQDTLIYTVKRGMVKIKDIRVGDLVYSWDENTNSIVTTPVRAVLNKGKRAVFEVTVRGKKIKATYNHPFLSLLDKRKSGRIRARYARQWEYLHALKKGDIVAVARNFPNFGTPHNFSSITLKKFVKGKNQFGSQYKLDISHSYKKVFYPTQSNDELMWLFGFYLGDGYITKSKNQDKMRLHFAIYEKDKEVRNKVKEIIKKYFGYEITTEDKYRISINSTAISLFFKENGFWGNARTKKIPDWVFTLPEKQIISLIAGYIDADGTVRKVNKDIILTSINTELLTQIKELCTYSGFDTSKITTFYRKDKQTKEVIGIGHRIQITGQNMSIPCVHPTKKERLLSKKGWFGKHNSLHGTTIRKYCSESVGFSRIDDIVYSGDEIVYDISVEKYKNFIANGFIVHNSDVVYHNIQEDLKKKGVIFENMDVAVQKYPDMVKKYFMTQCVPINDHKFVMLHGAVWSGGTFIYIPKGVKVELPLQAYFRMNAQSGGQFEHTLIIADEGSEISYIEGCSAPRYTTNSLHAGCVEIFVHKNAKVKYFSIENWSKNTWNLNTKRALVDEDASIEWVSGNMGSGVTMLYPCSILRGKGAHSDSLGIAFAGPGQNQDTGAKAIHAAPYTSSIIRSRSISVGGGIAGFRGLIKVTKKAVQSTASMSCDSLLLDEDSVANTYPALKIDTNDVSVAHEARVGKIGDEQLFYLMSRGLSEEQAMQLIVGGFIEPIVKALPLEYAIELHKLVEMEMEGAVG